MKKTNVIVAISHVNKDGTGRNVLTARPDGKFLVEAVHASYRVTANELVRCMVGYDPVLRLRDGQTVRAYQGGADALRVDAECCMDVHDGHFSKAVRRRK